MGAQLTSGSCDPDFDAVAASGLLHLEAVQQAAGCRDPRRVRASLEEVQVWPVHSE